MSKLDDLKIQIHFKENSIPSVHAGPMTEESKQTIKALMLEIIGEDFKDADFNSSNHILKERAIANNIKAEQRKALDEL